MRAVMLAYFVDVTPLLGVVVGGDLVVHALLISPEEPDITEYAPLGRTYLTPLSRQTQPRTVTQPDMSSYFLDTSVAGLILDGEL